MIDCAGTLKVTLALFDPNSTNAKVMVMFTDGKTTAGPDPNPVAAAARADGVIIYCIGLIGANGIAPAVLDEWATDPSETHVAITPDDADLEDLFEDLDVSGGSTTAMCNTRNFKARVFAHNIDSDFYCCNNVTF